MSAHRTVKANPPIPGHELLYEGYTRPSWYGVEPGCPPRQVGGCRCGAKPDDFPGLSANAMKRWHRQHKAQLREALS